MPRITMEQWPKVLEKLAEEIKLRWPWLSTGFYNSSLTLEDREENARVSGSVGLRIVPESRGNNTYLVPSVQVTGGGGLTGSLSEIEAGLRSYRTVVDALHFASARLGNTEVYPDALPCANCGGSGEIRESRIVKGRRQSVGDPIKCPACEGTGKQKPEDKDKA